MAPFRSREGPLLPGFALILRGQILSHRRQVLVPLRPPPPLAGGQVVAKIRKKCKHAKRLAGKHQPPCSFAASERFTMIVLVMRLEHPCYSPPFSQICVYLRIVATPLIIYVTSASAAGTCRGGGPAARGSRPSRPSRRRRNCPRTSASCRRLPSPAGACRCGRGRSGRG